MRRLILKTLPVVFLVVFAVQLPFLARVVWWAYFNPSPAVFMETGLARVQKQKPDAIPPHHWVPYERIPIHLKRAVVAAEDSHILTRQDFDREGMETAVEHIKLGRTVASGSSISQQLAKQLFLPASHSFLHDLQAAVITVMLEQLWSKRRLLEVYLNVVEWGSGIYGAEAAARHYYGIPAARLRPAQAAHLVAMLPNPRYYQTHRTAPSLRKRQAIIARRMQQVAVPQ